MKNIIITISVLATLVIMFFNYPETLLLSMLIVLSCTISITGIAAFNTKDGVPFGLLMSNFIVVWLIFAIKMFNGL